MSKFRLMLLSTAAAGLVSLAVSPASAGEVTKTLAVSGHINRAMIVTDNGENTTVALVDNNNTGESRFRLVGKAKSESLTFGTLIELGAAANRNVGSHAADSTKIRIRHSRLSVSNNMGTLYMGQTWAADWLSTSNYLGNTGAAGFYDGHTIGGEELRITGDTTPVSSGVTVNTVTANYTHYRSNLVKYVTPDMNGFKAEVSYSTGNHGAASLRYSGDFDGTKVVATAAVGSNASGSFESNAGGSIAVALPGGLNASLAYSEAQIDTKYGANAALKDPSMFGASVGYSMGANGITLWYQDNNDVGGTAGSDSQSVALVVAHSLKDYGASVYGGIENVSYDTATTNYDDLTAGWVGVKVTF